MHPRVMSNPKTAKHSAMPATVAAKQPPESLAAAAPPPPPSGSHITTVKPGLPAAATTIMRSSCLDLLHYQERKQSSASIHVQQQVLKFGWIQERPKERTLPDEYPLGASGNSSSKTRGQAVISTDSKLPMTASPHVQPITLQVKTDGTHQNPYHSPGVPPPARLMQDGPAGIPSGMIANHQQLKEGQSSNQKQRRRPPLKVEVRMVICSDQQDKVKSEAYRVDQVVGRPDKKDGRVDTRRDVKDSKTAHSDQGSKTKTTHKNGTHRSHSECQRRSEHRKQGEVGRNKGYHPVSANTPPVSVRQQTPNAIPVTTNIISSATIPVAKVYPRQQQTQPPPQQLQHGGNARVITSGVRLPVSTGTDTTSAPTNSFQPMQQSVNRAPILPPTLQNLSTGPGHNNRQHGPPPHTVISTQQPFHHAHNRYNFAQELFGYPMLQPYQYGPLQNSGMRGAQDGHPRYPYVTTSAPLSTVAGHPNATSIRYPLAMMIDPMTMGLATGVQTAADGHTGDGTHVTGSLNQVGPNPTSDSPTAVPNSGASPRPSILRKRASESSAFRRHPISTLNSSHLGRPDSPASKVDVMRQQLTPNASPKPNFKRGLNFNKLEREQFDHFDIWNE
ncbi:hypothetical protein BSL78_06981 [Apostichopus japonicus]|uniref:Uncharacterized protein n=1 Tax=Stichopus japonicus TaxID=307972 RepID=A0A2G8L7D2_STIJA|nr:hypothetical protein BSL78_06981 [Apostichopus japonicus]